MAITLIVNNQPFEYPEQGEQQPWAEGATGWANEVTKVLNSVNGPSDILESSATINNNITIPTDISGFFFDSTTVRSFAVRGNIYRNIDGTEHTEEFLLTGLYQGTSGWALGQQGLGSAGVSFTITNLGQIQYTSSNLAGSVHTGLIKFRGVGILQA